MLLGQVTSAAFKFFCSSGHDELGEDPDTPILCLTLCPSANRLVYRKLFYFLRTTVDWISLHEDVTSAPTHPQVLQIQTVQMCINNTPTPPPPPPPTCTLYSTSLQKDEAGYFRNKKKKNRIRRQTAR